MRPSRIVCCQSDSLPGAICSEATERDQSNVASGGKVLPHSNRAQPVIAFEKLSC
jgi:hypothetical protein